ncbi:basic leucine zipper and W2 domain-containing protein 2-like [Acanthaster planci]|uniref:Basic leucine zipper and W2 domain-containing protein 2-like n=1 Tax=Acanthaster planci TaxID=133434 RepID=A0A8B7XVT2_ACAPL|nr:basic leucine zipper and W2 domain-containing protein 2-like [Acanthaster planci]XP_022083956.1 basic leucine zipper and W2 domain-containing protein 2-like [Acanthaster planci]
MSNKQPKPVLTGQRIRTRKRDEKEKYDPNGFRDILVNGLNDINVSNLDEVTKYLDGAGSKLDYKRYWETLFDILLAGGILAPGGSLLQDDDKKETTISKFCLFSAEETTEAIKGVAMVFQRLTRRYRYLGKKLEDDEMKKILSFLKTFSQSERNKLAIFTGLFLCTGDNPAKCLESLYTETLVKEGISLEFFKVMFHTWLGEKDMSSIANVLRKASMDRRLLEVIPSTKRSEEYFEKCFNEAGLDQLVTFQRNMLHDDNKNSFMTELKELMEKENPPTAKELVGICSEMKTKTLLSEPEVVKLIWNCIMDIVEWNKKEELITDQALRHIKPYAPLLAGFTSQASTELTLLYEIQDYCYTNISFMKTFQKIVVLLYKTDVLSEETILKWNKEIHVGKGKSVFLNHLQQFVEWLENAEEESDEDD